MYMENEYCANHECLPVIKPESILSNILVSSAMDSRSCRSSYYLVALSSDGNEYFISKNVAEMMHRRTDCAPPLLTAGKLYLNSTPELS